MFKLKLYALCMAIVLVTGCSQEKENEVEIPPETRYMIGDVQVSVRAEKNVFNAGEDIHVTAEVENKGESDYIYFGDKDLNGGLYLSVNSEDNKTELEGEGNVMVGTNYEEYIEYVLKKDEKKEAAAQFMTATEDGEKLAPGIYVINAYYGDIVVPLEVKIEK